MAARERFRRRNLLRRERVFRDRLNPLENYNDDELRHRFRLPRSLILDICTIVSADIQRGTCRSQALPVQLMVCCVLRFLATGAIYSVLGDGVRISKSSVFRSILAVCDILAHHVRDFVKFPSSAYEVRMVKTGFFEEFRFPNVIGAIDGTHIPIEPPKDREYLYVNRKGFHSLNIQIVVDSKMKILSLVDGYPGRSHDSYIFECSYLAMKLRQKQIPGDGWLLGDSGDPQRIYLMTPVANPRTREEIAYNTCHARARSIVERAIGLLKARFRCLSRTSGAVRIRNLERVTNIKSAVILPS